MDEQQVCQTCLFQYSGSIKSYGSKDGARVVIHSLPSGPCEDGIADYTVGEDGIMTYHPRPSNKWDTNREANYSNSNHWGVEQ